jgi:hypothetical protein
LIEKADAFVIARVDHHVDARINPTLYTTHDCYIYRTLKGRLPSGRTTRLRLMDARTSFEYNQKQHRKQKLLLTRASKWIDEQLREPERRSNGS